MATTIELRQIRKAYGDVEVIHDVDLTIDPGDFTVFVTRPISTALLAASAALLAILLLPAIRRTRAVAFQE